MSDQKPVTAADSTQTPNAETLKKLEELKEPIHEELLEHQPSPTHTRVIAIALDRSADSEHAFGWSMKNLVNPETDQVVLLNVRDIVNVPSSFGLVYMDMGDWIDRAEQANMEESHKLLKQYGAKVLKAGAKCRAIALRGDPRDELVHKTKEIKADMLVLGSRGMGALKRTFLGSVSDYCVHHCSCPVVVVRRTEHETH